MAESDDSQVHKWRKINGRRVYEFQADLEPVTAHVAAQYHNTHGGASFYVNGGFRADKGYAVGGMPGVEETNVPRPHITPEEFQANRDRIRNLHPVSNAVAGTWVEDGRSIFDGSTVVRSREAAKHLQKKRNQRAVYDLGTDEEIDLR